MRILNIKALEQFHSKHPRSVTSLTRWKDITTLAKWNNFSELKASFNSADYVKGHVVFNISGNRYRLVTTINFESQLAIINHIFTHTEYNNWKP